MRPGCHACPDLPPSPPGLSAAVEPGAVEAHAESADQGIVGYIQESQNMPGGGEVVIPDEAQRAWNFLNIQAIQPQMPYALMPFFILQLPEEGRSFTQLPLRVEPITLSEGNHFSYAIQWFMFATILGIGYILFVRHTEQRAKRIAAAQAAQEEPEANLPIAHHGASYAHRSRFLDHLTGKSYPVLWPLSTKRFAYLSVAREV